MRIFGRRFAAAWPSLVVASLLAAAPCMAGEPVTLDAAYQLALGASERVEIARRRVDEADLEPWRVVTRMTPRAGVGATWTREKEAIEFQGSTASSSVIRPLEAWSGELVATQPLLEAEVFPEWDSAEANAARAREDYGSEVRDVLYEVAVAYHEVLRAEQQLAVLDERVELAGRELTNARARYEAGATVRTDVLRAEVERSRAERDRIRVGGALEVARRSLERLTGVSADAELVAPPEGGTLSLDVTELVPRALAARTELRALERAAEAADADRRTVWARYLPDVQAAWRYPKLEEPTFAQPDGQWTLTLELAVSLFDGGERIVDLRQARSRQTRSELAVADLRERIGVEVARAVTDVRTELETIALTDREVELADESYRIASERYAAGTATSLEVLTALDDLASARTARVERVHHLAIARLTLERTVGTFASAYVERARAPEEG